MQRLMSAFRNSLRGLGWAAVRQELVLLALGLPLAFWLARDAVVFFLLAGGLLLLLAVELLNTAIEKLCDFLTLDHHAQIGLVKDLGSATVLAMLLFNAALWGYFIIHTPV